MSLGLFGDSGSYDRRRILRAASRARSKGRKRTAIALYRRVLSVEPDNPELHAKLAPLLARTGQDFDAWRSFRAAARELLRVKRVEQALGIYREAARCLPRQIEVWQAISKLEQRLGRDRDALETLVEGRRRFRSRRLRAQAIHLLRRAREIEPWDLNTVLDLARLLKRSDQRHEALRMLEQLAARSRGRSLRRVRGAQWRMTRTLRHTWLWMSAAVATLRGENEEPAPRPNVLPLTRSVTSRR